MAKKLKLNLGSKGKSVPTGGDGSGTTGELGKVIKDSAQEIWLAGLGAYSRAQEEGAKVFETLVKAGQDLQRKTQGAAGPTVEAMASRAADTWSKLEHVFEDRVSRSLGRLGVPNKSELHELSDKITELNKSVQALMTQQKPAARKPASATGAARSLAGKAVKEVKKAAKPVIRRATRTATAMRDTATGIVAETVAKTVRKTMGSSPKR